MKRTKRIFAIFMTLALAMSMLIVSSAVSFAADGDTTTTYTITMDSSAGHTYKAYQVFSGDLSKDGKLSNIVWGTGVDGTAALAALKTDATYGNAFEKCTSAADVADVLATYADKGDDIAKIAKIIGANKTTAAATGTTSITNLAAGYYLIVDETAAADMPDGNTYSDFMLEVVKNVNVTAKDTTTTSQKKVKDINDSTDTEESSWQDSADWDVGDTVPFQLIGRVASDFAKYDSYYFAFHDVQSPGLTFNENSVVVYLGETGDTVIPTDKYKVVTTGLTDGCTFEVVFEDLTKVQGVAAGSVIRVEYNSTLNDHAVMGSAGNPNTSHIEFSNNPNGDQHGKTPDDTVIVFTYKIVVNKTDSNNNPLAGAGFTLYKKNSTGEYVAVGEQLTGEQMTTFTWNRIDDGDYKIVETKTPEGYNTIDPIEFSVTANHDITSNDPKLTELSVNSDDATFTVESTQTESGGATYTGSISTDVVNKSGAELPSTGGIGTVIFYVLGSLLVVGCGIVLISKRRMESR